VDQTISREFQPVPVPLRNRTRKQERELRLAREAIAMVACGASPRVVVAGIQFGDEILDTARRLALEAGVRVTPLRTSNGRGADLVVEPIHD
jgi:hypothetical protein